MKKIVGILISIGILALVSCFYDMYLKDRIHLLTETKEIIVDTPSTTDSTDSSLQEVGGSNESFGDGVLGNTVLSSQTFIEINLTKMTLKLYTDGQLLKTYTVIHKGPDDKWFRTPTGYFKVISKQKNHFSSKFPVYMPYSIQFYEDFFIHGIPYYENGEKVPPRFTGGCLRLEDEDAKELYEFSKVGMPVVIFNELDCSINNINWQLPVDCANSWVRQNFNSPLKLSGAYYQHTGLDIGANSGADVNAIGNGKIKYLQYLGSTDHGLGNAVILEHNLKDGSKIYSLYAHLDSFSPEIYIDKEVLKGEVIGKLGASGYGCSHFWRIGQDGCESKELIDYHLHFEIKKAPVLENPELGLSCLANNKANLCYGYTPTYPQGFGYLDPIKFIQENI